MPKWCSSLVRPGGAHKHPGFVLVYVVEGEVVTRISGQPERTYKAGEVFWEPPGSTHEVSRNPSDTKPVKFVAFLFAQEGPGPDDARIAGR